ncbi:MAG: hypothetical protein ACRCZJ_06560 [Erysipelotrichaceae bacterium]
MKNKKFKRLCYFVACMLTIFFFYRVYEKSQHLLFHQEDNIRFLLPSKTQSGHCSAMKEIDRDKSVTLILEQLQLYPKSLQESYTFEILLCEQISSSQQKHNRTYISGTTYSSTFSKYQNSFYFAFSNPNSMNNYYNEILQRSVHHEMLHAIDLFFLDSDWNLLYQGYDRNYSISSYDYLNFITPYASYSASEDKAETFEKLILGKQNATTYFRYPVTIEKATRLKNELLAVFPDWDILLD